MLVALPVMSLTSPGHSTALSTDAPRTRFVSTTSDGEQANGESYEVDVSANGRFIAFTSSATNLTRNATGTGVYLKKRRTGAVERIDIGVNGKPGKHFAVDPSISANGRFIAFTTGSRLVGKDDDNESDVYVRDHRRNETTLVGLRPGGGHWEWEVIAPSISPDGRFVTFQAFRTPNKYEHDSFDAYMVDRRTGESELISVSSNEEFGDSSSWAGSVADGGRLVTFVSYATNFSDIDTDRCSDVFMRDRLLDTTELVSVDSQEQAGTGCNYTPQVSADGRYVFFTSYSSTFDEVQSRLADCFVRDRSRGKTYQVNVRRDGWRPKGYCHASSISLGGHYVSFWTSGGERNLPGTYEVYFGIWRKDIVTRVSVSPKGAPANLQAAHGEISGRGNWVGFVSEATNLVKPDSNSASDVFLRGPML